VIGNPVPTVQRDGAPEVRVKLFSHSVEYEEKVVSCIALFI